MEAKSLSFLKNIEIQNFKSIKKLRLEPKRVNLFIGKPNSGKSNLLEAISLLGAPMAYKNKPFLSDYIRFDNYNDLFYDLNLDKDISVKSNIGNAFLRQHFSENFYLMIGINETDLKKFSKLTNLQFVINEFGSVYSHSLTDEEINHSAELNFTGKLKPYFRSFTNSGSDNDPFAQLTYRSPVKKYVFGNLKYYGSPFGQFFTSTGDNLYTILQNDQSLKEFAGRFFAEFKFDFFLITNEKKFVIQKKVGNVGFQLPFSLTPDTFQRILFHLAAIKSNYDSVILFEEPEAHSFPPYIAMVCELIAKNSSNQYFITTHSPYAFQSLISNTNKSDLNVYLTYYKNSTTQVKLLSERELSLMLSEGIDIFLNINRYIK